MWSVRETKTNKYFYLVPKCQIYQVGRSTKDISLEADSSVSDLHAKFYVIGSVNDFASLEIKSCADTDVYINENIENNISIPKEKRIKLEENDRLRFGTRDCFLIVHRHKFNVLTSSLDYDKRTKVWRIVLGIGCRMIDIFKMNGCNYTHLTLEEETFTVKMLHALITQKQIVTIEYWKALYQIIKFRQNTLLPEPNKFRPQCGHNFDMGPRAERRNIFHGFEFIFLNENHVNMYAPLVELAGGVHKAYTESLDKEYLLNNKVATILYINATENEYSVTSSILADYLTKNSRRIIPEYEIGLAILSCSTKHYCNSLSKATAVYTPNTKQSSQNMGNMNSVNSESNSSMRLQDIDNSVQKSTSNSQTSSVKTETMSQICVTEKSMEKSISPTKRPSSTLNTVKGDDNSSEINECNPAKRVCKSSDNKIKKTNSIRFNTNASDLNNVDKSKLSLTNSKREKNVIDDITRNSIERRECKSSENSLKTNAIATHSIESDNISDVGGLTNDQAHCVTNKITMSSNNSISNIFDTESENVRNTTKSDITKKKLCPRIKLPKLNNKILFAAYGTESQVICKKKDESVHNNKEIAGTDIKFTDVLNLNNTNVNKALSVDCKVVPNDNDKFSTNEQTSENDFETVGISSKNLQTVALEKPEIINARENVLPRKKACRSQPITEIVNVEKNTLPIINENIPIPEKKAQTTKKSDTKSQKYLEGFIRTKKRENNKLMSESRTREEELRTKSILHPKSNIMPSPSKKSCLRVINESNNSEFEDELFAFGDTKTNKNLPEKSEMQSTSPTNDLFNFEDSQSKTVNLTEKQEDITLKNKTIEEQEKITTIGQPKQENLQNKSKFEKWPKIKRSVCTADIPWTCTKKAANKTPYASIDKIIKYESDYLKESKNKPLMDVDDNEEDNVRVPMDPSMYRMRVIAYHHETKPKKENESKVNLKYLNKTERVTPIIDQRSTKVVNFKKFVRVQHKFLRREIRSQEIAEKLKLLEKANSNPTSE